MMVFGVKSAAAVGAKGTVINMIINRWLTCPFVDMTWLDSDGKYHMLSESLLFKMILFLYFKRYIFDINILMTVYFVNKKIILFFKISRK